MRRGGVDRVIIVEVQLQRRSEKTFSLPEYQALARARHKTPCEVIVVTPTKAVARWLGQPIELGGGSRLQAVFVGPDELLRLDAARRRNAMRAADARLDITVEVAFLRALALGRDDLRLITTAALVFDAMLPIERAALYFDVVLDVLPISKRRALESFMEKERLKFRSEFMRNLVKEGLAKGEAKGRAIGEAKGLRGAIRTLLEARDIQLSATQRRQLDSCEDVSVLNEWVKRAAQAKAARDVFPPGAGRARSPAGRQAAHATSPSSAKSRPTRSGNRRAARAR